MPFKLQCAALSCTQSHYPYYQALGYLFRPVSEWFTVRHLKTCSSGYLHSISGPCNVHSSHSKSNNFLIRDIFQ